MPEDSPLADILRARGITERPGSPCPGIRLTPETTQDVTHRKSVVRHERKLARRGAVALELVRQRDGDICWRCGHGMDFTEPRKGRKSATIEHVMPLSLGGTWALENLVLCHVGCNRHLGANPPEQKQRMRLRR